MDKVLKQRLIGAAILIALAVIFLPMLFDGPDERPTRELAIDLPDPPEERAPVRRLPLDPDQARGVASESTAPARAPVRVEPPPVVPPPQVAPSEAPVLETEDRRRAELSEQPEPDPVAEPEFAELEPEPEADEPAVVAAEPETEERPAEPLAMAPAPDIDAEPVWLVQVASFGSSDSANDVAEQLNRLGHITGIDPLVRGETTLYRVVTGPYAERSDADRAREQIMATVAGVEPFVRAGPAPTDMLASGSEAAIGYAVQVGSFASRTNAERLRDQIQSHQLPGFLHQDQSGSRAIWRVRIGPTSSRAQAEALLEQVAQVMPVEGLIVSHP